MGPSPSAQSASWVCSRLPHHPSTLGFLRLKHKLRNHMTHFLFFGPSVCQYKLNYSLLQHDTDQSTKCQYCSLPSWKTSLRDLFILWCCLGSSLWLKSWCFWVHTRWFSCSGARSDSCTFTAQTTHQERLQRKEPHRSSCCWCFFVAMNWVDLIISCFSTLLWRNELLLKSAWKFVLNVYVTVCSLVDHISDRNGHDG